MTMRILMLAVVVLAVAGGVQAKSMSANVEVGGQPMLPMKDIVDNAVNSADHTTLVAAVKAAGLVETLKGKGPFTVFAPTNDAFENLPAGTVETLLEAKNKPVLTSTTSCRAAGTRSRCARRSRSRAERRRSRPRVAASCGRC
jgi:uncharacterized surface protein with fasciclin (FAS1) repeats